MENIFENIFGNIWKIYLEIYGKVVYGKYLLAWRLIPVPLTPEHPHLYKRATYRHRFHPLYRPHQLFMMISPGDAG